MAMRRFVVGLLLVVSAAALLLSSTSLWARQNVIDTGGFIGNAEAIIDQPQVQARLAAGTAERIVGSPKVKAVVDEATAGLPPILQRFRPTVADGVKSLITTGAGQLLAAQPFRPLARAALTSAHQQLVNGQEVRFTLGQAKDRLPASVKTGLAGQVLDLIPSDAGVTLISPNDAPMLYLSLNLLKVAWWVAGLVAILALAGALVISHRRRKTLRAWAVTLSVLVGLLLVTLRVGREVLLGQVRPVNRGAIGAVYDGIAGSARSWTLWLLAFAVLVIVVTSLLPVTVRAIRRGRAAAVSAAEDRRARA